MRTIGIVGSQDRIGATTQALQIVLHLQEMEYDSAYIEMGRRGYIQKIKERCNGIIETEESIICNSIAMYPRENIINANRKQYDYLVKDYGNMCDPEFEKISFLEQDIKIVVAGSKANEVGFVEQIMKQDCYRDVNYIFSFVAKDEWQDTKADMGISKEYTYFALYTPDPFVLVENESYYYLLGEHHGV